MTETKQIEIAKILADKQAQPREQINENTINEYRQDMLVGAIFPPIVAFYDGLDYWLADGFHRLLAAQDIGKTHIETEVRLGDIRQAILYSVGANASHGLRRTNEDKRRAVMKLLEDEEWGKWSDNEIARRCAVSQPFVSSLRGLTYNDYKLERTYTTKHGTTAIMNTKNIGSNGTVPVPLIEAYDKWDDTNLRFNPENQAAYCKYCYDTHSHWKLSGDHADPMCWECLNCNHFSADDYLEIEEIEAQNQSTNKPHVYHNSGNNEWYTPPEYIEAARAVMRHIDIDPASTPQANEVVKADFFYTAETNGLEAEWWGNVWLNPPYASDLIVPFCEKLVSDFASGEIENAIVLVNNATETAWFNLLSQFASCICFPKSRVKYWGPNGQTGAPLQGQAFLYFGKNDQRFIEEFQGFGFVVEVVNGNVC